MDNPTSPAPRSALREDPEYSRGTKPPISLNLAFLLITLVSLFLSAFFIYQNWRLSQKLAALIRSQPTPAPMAPISPSPTPDPTANWKTHTDDKLGFSIKYPSNWTILPQVVKDGNWTSATLLLVYSPGTIMQEGEPIVEMIFSVNALKPEVYSIDKQVLSYSRNFGGEASNIEIYKIGTFQGKTISVKGSVGNIDRKAVFIEKDNLIYHIDLLWKSEQQGFETTMDQVLSTFKFLGQTSDVSNWKIYIDSKNNFSIRYPSTWRSALLGENGIGFGPKETGEDVLWGVNVFDKATNSVNKIVDDQGKQFSDRKQITNKISVNGISASQVITTTATNPSWYYETIIFETSNTIITISNGAIKDEGLSKMPGVPEGTLFKDFYSTFKFTQ